MFGKLSRRTKLSIVVIILVLTSAFGTAQMVVGEPMPAVSHCAGC